MKLIWAFATESYEQFKTEKEPRNIETTTSGWSAT